MDEQRKCSNETLRKLGL